MPELKTILLIIVLAPLVGAFIAGVMGPVVGRVGAHTATIGAVAISCVLSFYVLWLVVMHGVTFNETIYNWAIVDHHQFKVGFLIDKLSAFMMVIVTFVSLLVHIYTIGYMEEDPGYQRFFSYICGFTFAMLTLVMGNSFLLLFFGWEGVGVASYLLISFWFHKPKATYASLKAFLANRVGDFGFILGIAAVMMYFGTLDYAQVFAKVPQISHQGLEISIFPGSSWSVITVACILLFVGAMGKSAQIPLHVWLEGSMEGPTPISALIHAATMVTAGVFMVARLSPMFEFSPVALNFVLLIGATTSLLMGLIAITHMDIKRIIAYSTLSQLGYMIAAQGASAFPIGMFHLMTHAFFKALLFLAAGAVILAYHHEHDIGKMGGLRKKLPITYVCMLIGGLALAAIPPFAGFYSKDLIIDAVGHSTLPGAGVAYFMLVAGAFVTAVYTFRLIFYVFHGKPRMSKEAYDHIKEPHWTVILPLVVLSVPATLMGLAFFHPALEGFFGNAVYIAPQFNVVGELNHHLGEMSVWQFALHAVFTLPFWLAVSGVIVSWVCYAQCPKIPERISERFKWVHILLSKKYYVDEIYHFLFAKGTLGLGNAFWKIGDIMMIDNGIVNGTGRAFKWTGSKIRHLQTGYLHQYAFVMIIGLLAFLGWVFLVR